MDRQHFFAEVRTTVFAGSMAQSQVDGIEAILNACAAEQIADGRQVAHILATPMVETGGTFLTKSESLNYSPRVCSTPSAQAASRLRMPTSTAARLSTRQTSRRLPIWSTAVNSA